MIKIKTENKCCETKNPKNENSIKKAIKKVFNFFFGCCK